MVRLLATMQEQGTMILPSFFGKAARSVPRRGEIPVIPVAAGSPQHSRNCNVLLAGARAANMPDNETNPKETYYIVSG